MSEKTILRLHANGDFEVVDTPFVEGEGYSFGPDAIKVPKIVKLKEKVNLFKEEESVAGYINENNGQISLGYGYDRASGFIAVKTGQMIKVDASYIDIINARPWVCLCFYDANKSYVSTFFARHGLPGGVSEGTYTNIFNVPEGVHFIRFSTNLYTHPTTKVSIVIEEDGGVPLPYWAVDTGNLISFFPQGVAIKGELIQKEIEPPLEDDVIFADNFNRLDSSNLGGNWTNARGSWGVENNKARPTTSNSIALYTQHHGDNVSISADITRVRSDGVVFRAKDANNHLYVQFENDMFRLKLLTNGTVTTLKTADIRTNLNQTYRTRIELRGANIKVFVDDILCITHETSTYLNENLTGLQSWSQDGNNGRFDNFEIRKLPLAIDTLIFDDNFERPNSNNLGADWQLLSGGFSVSNGLARNHIVTLPESIAVTNVGTQNNIGIKLGVLIPNIREGIVFRVVDVSNYIKTHYRTNNNSLSVIVRVNGVETVLAETTLNLIKGEPYSFRVELRGEEIKVFVDNELKITTRESRFIETERCGMLGYSMDYTNGGYDSFEVRRLGN